MTKQKEQKDKGKTTTKKKKKKREREREKKEEIANGNQMTALRFQTGGWGYQTPPASLPGMV